MGNFYFSKPLEILLYSAVPLFISYDDIVLGSYNLFKRIHQTLRELYKNTEFFLARIFPHSDWIRRDSISPYSVRMRENPGQKNSAFGDFSRSESLIQCLDCRFIAVKFLLLQENTRNFFIHENLPIGVSFRYIVIYVYVYNLPICCSFLMTF